VILRPVNANRNPFIYLHNMGKVMTSGGTAAGQSLLFAALIASAIGFPIGSGARAETGAWAESAHAKVRLVSAMAATGGAHRVQLGLEIKLDDGWKTYWRAPGEGGMPPRFDWNGSGNLAHIDVAWPAPKRFAIGGLESVGYADHVILPLEAVIAQAGEPLALRLSLQYAVCREICMLVDARLRLDLPGLAQQTSETLSNAEAIERFQALVPRPGAEQGWKIAAVTRKHWGEGAERRELVVVDVATDGAPFAAPWLLIEGAGIRFGKAVIKPAPTAGQVRFVAPMHIAADAPAGDLVLTLINGERAGAFAVRMELSAR
jgi:suppressor for copper-sensitivity B